MVEGLRITLPLLGQHQASNAMLAWTLGQELSIDPSAAAEALRGLRIPGGRGEIIEAGGLTIINDAYNANPSSFMAAIATARAMRGRALSGVRRGDDARAGSRVGPAPRAVAAALVGLEPDLLAAVGDFVPVLTLIRDGSKTAC
jgi:UDP-N-acetylmuramoyl-tripeptide--D-alanyl-D-alanine ligase